MPSVSPIRPVPQIPATVAYDDLVLRDAREARHRHVVSAQDDSERSAGRDARHHKTELPVPDLAATQKARAARRQHVVSQPDAAAALTAAVLRAKACHLGRYWPRTGR